jgi:hypothetical protein
MDVLAVDLMTFLAGDKAVKRVARYHSDAKPTFAGRKFESLGGGGDRPAVVNEFTAEDLVAVSLLSVHIPGEAALEILEAQSEELNGLLSRIPHDVTLWDADPSIVDDKSSDAASLWHKLDHITGVGWVTANKLLARKRPHLLPVYDRVVKAALQPRRKDFWIPLRNSLLSNDGEAIARLEEIRVSAGLMEGHPLLRVLDVAVWMTSQP